MMNKIIGALGSLAIVAAGFLALSSEPAKAQSVTYTCEAASPYATGYWTAQDGNYACRRAVYECAIRTPVGFTCYVTRWWTNY